MYVITIFYFRSDKADNNIFSEMLFLCETFAAVLMIEHKKEDSRTNTSLLLYSLIKRRGTIKSNDYVGLIYSLHLSLS